MNTKEIVQSTVDYIESHLNDTLELDAIAERIGYSKFYLNRLFLDTVGLTMIKYIRMRRLTNSAQQLVETDKPIVDIALGAGYKTQQAYHHAFSAVYNCTPMVYRMRAIFLPALKRFTTSSMVTMRGRAA